MMLQARLELAVILFFLFVSVHFIFISTLVSSSHPRVKESVLVTGVWQPSMAKHRGLCGRDRDTWSTGRVARIAPPPEQVWRSPRMVRRIDPPRVGSLTFERLITVRTFRHGRNHQPGGFISLGRTPSVTQRQGSTCSSRLKDTTGHHFRPRGGAVDIVVPMRCWDEPMKALKYSENDTTRYASLRMSPFTVTRAERVL